VLSGRGMPDLPFAVFPLQYRFELVKYPNLFFRIVEVSENPAYSEKWFVTGKLRVCR